MKSEDKEIDLRSIPCSNKPPISTIWSEELERLFMAIAAAQKQVDQANNSIAEIRKKAMNLVLSVTGVK